jgi:3-oxoacyl-[acyl-carrier-protein] synthase II
MATRVVVTGIGVVTAIGTGRDAFWDSLLSGRSAFAPIESFDSSRYEVRVGAEVKHFRPPDDLPSVGRASQFAIVATRLALRDAGLSTEAVDADRAGVAIGTTSGEPQFVERFDDEYLAQGGRRMSADLVSRYPCHLLPAHVANDAGWRGVNLTIPTACAAGNHAIAYASDMLRSGRADVMLAGGSDSFSRITYTGFARLSAVAPERCQPFDRRRKGMIPGEGAAMLVLESASHAVARGAFIYAEIAGYGLSCDAHHMTGGHPQGDGAVRAMEAALRGSGIEKDAVSYISAHGTGTMINDRLETLAVKRVFGESAYRIPTSSIKSMIGHAMGAASAIEAATCALAVTHDRIPPTMHLEEPDPDCDLDYVPNRARAHVVDVAMNNAYGFGGNNASLILRKWRPEA